MSVWLSVHDYSSAKIAVEAGINTLLVGDSLGMTVYGMKDTKSVTLEMILRHTESVIRAVPKGFPVVADMPIGTCNTPEEALKNAKSFRAIGTSRIKIEGGKEREKQIEILVKNGFEVTGHLGLLPQTAEKFSVVGKDDLSAKRILMETKLLEKLGAQNIVLECVPSSLAEEITNAIQIPTVGIGAGAGTSAQILVFNDVVGRSDLDFSPKFLRRFGNVFEVEKEAIQKYIEAVKNSDFPNTKESY